MKTATERLEPKLRDSALTVLRRHNIPEDELTIEVNEPGKPVYCLIRGYRVRVHVDDGSVSFHVRAGRWSAARIDFPTTGAFIADFETALNSALADEPIET